MQVFDRLGGVGAPTVMVCQLTQVVLQLAAEQRLDCLRSAFVQLLAPFAQYRVVGHLLRQRVLEDVFDIANGGLLVNELRQLQVGEHAVQFVIRG